MSWAAIGGAAVSTIGGALLSKKGSSGSQVQTYQPKYLQQADQQFSNMSQGYTNPYTAISGYNTDYLNRSQNNPYLQNYENVTNNAAAGYGQLGGAQSQFGNAFANYGVTGLSQANAMMGNLNALGAPTQQMVNSAQTGGGYLQQQGLNSLGYANQLPGMAQNALGGLQGLAQGYAGNVQGYADNVSGSLPGLAQGYADPLSSYARNLASTLPGYAQSTTQSLLPTAMAQNQGLTQGANAVMQSAFDPQNAQYAKDFMQNREQTRASLASRGLNQSATGAGIENESNLAFNTNWRNQQLGRQQSGLQSYAGALGQGLGGLTSAAGATYAPYSNAITSGLGALDTAANTGYGMQSGALGQSMNAQNMAANTGYGMQSGAADQYLQGMTGAYQNADALGRSGAQSYMSGGAAGYNALSGSMNNYAGLLGNLGQAGNTYGSMTSNGLNMVGQGVGNYYLSGQLPYSTYQGVLNDQYGGMGNYMGLAGQGQTFDNEQMNQLLNYMNVGTGASNAANYGSSNAFNQNQTNMKNIGSLINGVGNMFNGSNYNPNQSQFYDWLGGISSGFSNSQTISG